MKNNHTRAETWAKLAEYGYETKSGLIYVNEFTFLVAILLSAQARDEFINTQTPEFFKIAPDAPSMLALGVEEIGRYIQRIGLWRNKAKNIFALSKKVVEFQEIKAAGHEKTWYEGFLETRYEDSDMHLYADPLSQEGIPSFRRGLLELDGIGRKSANVFLNCVYQAPVFAVDTHVQRVGGAHRLNVALGRNPFEIEKMMEETVPAKYAVSACHWLVWHGRKICLARKPNCRECHLREYCNFLHKDP